MIALNLIEYFLMKKFLCVLGFVSSLSLAQKYEIIDEKTEAPVAFAHIDFLNGKGTYSDDNGMFTMPLETSVDSIRISCIGYKSKKIHVNSLKDEKIISLKGEALGLNEIYLKSRFRKVLKHHKKMLNLNLDVGGFGYDQLVLTFVPFPENLSIDNARIKSIVVNTTGLRSKKRRYYPFKVNLFSTNKNTKYPNVSDTLLPWTVASRRIGRPSEVFVSIDKSYNVAFGKNGIFVGFQTLSKESYPEDEHYNVEKVLYFSSTSGHNNYGAAVKSIVPKDEGTYSFRQVVQEFQNSQGEEVVHKYWEEVEGYIYDLTIEIEY